MLEVVGVVVVAQADRGHLVRFRVGRRNSPRAVVDRGLAGEARPVGLPGCVEVRWGRDLGPHVCSERLAAFRRADGRPDLRPA